MGNGRFLGETPDISQAFKALEDTYFFAERLSDFDAKTLTATLHFSRQERKGRYSFGATSAPFAQTDSWAFPPAYPEKPAYRIAFSFCAADTFRILTVFDRRASLEDRGEADGLMIERLPRYDEVAVEQLEDRILLTTRALLVTLWLCPFAVDFRDREGGLLTRLLSGSDSMCLHNDKILSMGYVQSLKDRGQRAVVSLNAAPGEHFYGCGESFTALNKRGQKLQLFTKDPHSCQTGEMYKPVPFYISSRGYGVFAHTSVPMTFDLGCDYQQTQTLYSGEGGWDLFFFAGGPKDVLKAYTALTGRAPMPPVWSFGLWMSRITYQSQRQVEEVAQNLEKYQIPCDVIHLDTGWFEEDWNCDYRFSASRFPDPAGMLAALRRRGLRVSLWQLPYFTPTNRLYGQLLADSLGVADANGGYPTEDMVLDFSNPRTVAWYQQGLGSLFSLGVAVIKTDFGEAAPIEGIYASGKSGWLEHNLYPLRYNQAASEASRKAGGDGLVWARSSWAGGQRYPVHWGGDTENTDMAMLAVLRGGLSLGMCGFSFWSHDLGGFVRPSPEELYRRWSFMGMFTSHMRVHGQPPTEPWAYSQEFLALFRRQMNFRYRLLPYVLEQSRQSAQSGLPMMRAMFLAFPEDPACLDLEDQYMFGEDILVAPFFEADARTRWVWLPRGGWVDLFTGRFHDGGGWCLLEDGGYRGIAMAREGAIIPMVDPALSTDAVDWSTRREYRYAADGIHLVEKTPSGQTSK